MRTSLLATVAVAAVASPAMAQVTSATDWEDPSADALLGTFGNVGDYGYDQTDPFAGNNSLFIMEEPLSGTPQGYVAWIRGLSEGDTVTVSMWFKGEDSGSGDTIAKGRLWAHYTDEVDNTSYLGSASGPSDYAGDEGVWEQSTYTWTIAAGQTALMIEARLYSYGENNMILGDDLFVTVSNDNANITLAGVVPAPGAIALLGVAGLAGRRRRA
jgi:hypothetical protein